MMNETDKNNEIDAHARRSKRLTDGPRGGNHMQRRQQTVTQTAAAAMRTQRCIHILPLKLANSSFPFFTKSCGHVLSVCVSWMLFISRTHKIRAHIIRKGLFHQARTFPPCDGRDCTIAIRWIIVRILTWHKMCEVSSNFSIDIRTTLVGCVRHDRMEIKLTGIAGVFQSRLTFDIKN